MSAYIQGRLEDAVLSGSVIWDRGRDTKPQWHLRQLDTGYT